ncbi:MAG: hypothetical protein GF383_14610, partial [Candidatus Lokiarchaeota archaeon]|nr:hypothetical protein [Candidatus Lokiarchaeota archaeon]MBD3342649.1 hypothetical protein [Candidatus Lokiarchaeota archaeon]
MHLLKAKFPLMIYTLMSEFNPEVVEKVVPTLPKKIEELDPEEFYDSEYMRAFLRELSPMAQEVLGKRVFPTTEKTEHQFEGVTDPAIIFKAWGEHYLDNNIEDEGRDLGGVQSVDVEDGRAVIVENTHWPGDFNRGITMGIVQIAGVKGTIRATTDIV